MPANFSIKEYEKRSRIIIDRIRAGATPFSDQTFEAKQQRKARARTDKAFFFRTYLPHWFTGPGGAFTDFCADHHRLMKCSDELFNLHVVAGYREFGKSTILRADALHAGVFDRFRFIPYISFSEANSINILQPIKLEYEHNERLKSDFGELPGKSDWSMEKFVNSHGICYQAFGRDDVVRSQNYNGIRMQLIIMDDMEDPNKSANIKQVEKYVRWIESDVLFAKDSTHWVGVFLGNWVQVPSIIDTLMTGKNTAHYKKLVFRVLNELDKSNWEERHPTVKMLEERKNNPETFATERMQYPRDAATKKFKREWFRFVPRNTAPAAKSRVAVVWDPATGSKLDYHSILAVSIDERMQITVHDAWLRNDESKWTALKVWFRFARQYNADLMVVEGNAFQKTLKEDYYKYIADEQIIPPGRLVVEASTDNKESRISRLEGPIENGIVQFCEAAGDMNTLLYQLENYPSVNDDGPDSLAQAFDRLKNIWHSDAEYKSLGRREARFNEGAW